MANMWDFLNANQEQAPIPMRRPAPQTPAPVRMAQPPAMNRRATPAPSADNSPPLGEPVQPPPGQVPMQMGGAAMGFSMPQQYSPEERKQMAFQQSKYESLVGEQMKKQAGQVSQMQQNLTEYKQEKPGLNLAPLASYIDFLNKGKSNVLAGYQASGMAPESKRERGANIRKMEEGIAKAQNKLTSQELDAMKTLMNARKSSSTWGSASMYRTQTQRAMQEKRISIGLEKDLRKDLSKEVLDPMNKSKVLYGKIKRNVQEGNIRDIYMTLGSIVRNIGEEKGNLSEGDIRRALYEDLETKLNKAQAWFGDDGATISPENLEALKRVITNAEIETMKGHSNRLDQVRKTYEVGGSYSPFLQKDGFAHKMFEGAKADLVPSQAPASTAAQALAKKQERLKELRAKSKGVK